MGKGAKPAESSGESVGLWYVSFSDMVTLLLAFFVMLCGFSSYNKDSLDKFAGACASIANASIFSGRTIRDGLVSPADRVLDVTEDGSEKPTGAEWNNIRHPREAQWLADMAGAYADRRVFYVPTRRLFYGQGTLMTQAGKQHLDLLASFMRMVPCHVVVGVVLPPKAASPEEPLDRPWAVIEYFTTRGGLEKKRFSMAAAPSASAKGLDQEPMLEIVLLSGSFVQ